MYFQCVPDSRQPHLASRIAIAIHSLPLQAGSSFHIGIARSSSRWQALSGRCYRWLPHDGPASTTTFPPDTPADNDALLFVIAARHSVTATRPLAAWYSVDPIRAYTASRSVNHIASAESSQATGTQTTSSDRVDTRLDFERGVDSLLATNISSALNPGSAQRAWRYLYDQLLRHTRPKSRFFPEATSGSYLTFKRKIDQVKQISIGLFDKSNLSRIRQRAHLTYRLYLA